MKSWPAVYSLTVTRHGTPAARAGSGRQTETVEYPAIDIGGRLLCRDHVAGADDFEPVRGFRPQAGPEQRLDIRGRSGGGDRQPDAGPARFVDQSGNAGAQGQATLVDETEIMSGLGQMQLSDENREVGIAGDVGGVTRSEVADALLAAGNIQQATIERFIPVPVEAGFGEGGIEGRAVPVAFGFCKGPVNIEDQSV